MTSLAKIKRAAGKQWSELRARNFDLLFKDEGSKPRQTIASESELRAYVASRQSASVKTKIRPPQFPELETAQRLQPVVVKILNPDGYIGGCGYLLTPKHVLTSTELIKDTDDLQRFETILYYHVSKRKEIVLNIKQRGKRLCMSKYSAMIFELAEAAPDFPTEKFIRKPLVSAREYRLELISAS